MSSSHLAMSTIVSIIVVSLTLFTSDISCSSTIGKFKKTPYSSNDNVVKIIKEPASEDDTLLLIAEKQEMLQKLAAKLISNDTGEIDAAIMTSMLEVFLQYFKLVEGDPETVAIIEYLMQMSKGGRFWESFGNLEKVLSNGGDLNELNFNDRVRSVRKSDTSDESAPDWSHMRDVMGSFANI